MDELEAILLGQGQYGRARGAEPELLFFLIPRLADDELLKLSRLILDESDFRLDPPLRLSIRSTLVGELQSRSVYADVVTALRESALVYEQEGYVTQEPVEFLRADPGAQDAIAELDRVWPRVPVEARRAAVGAYVEQALVGPPEEAIVETEQPAEDAAEEPVVNLGFSETDDASRTITERGLAPGRSYHFWVEVGAKLDTAIGGERLDTKLLPREAALSVVLFSFPGELELEDDLGELRLDEQGAKVLTPADSPKTADPAMLERRLFFRIGTPAHPGRHRLRCNIYCQQVLVQSYLVEAEVADLEQEVPVEQPFHVQLDYVLTERLDGALLGRLGSHQLSLMFNEQDASTHNVRLFGPDGFRSGATIMSGVLKTEVDKARGGLRRVAWGDEHEWDSKTKHYHYGPQGGGNLKDDLALLAIRGFRLYDALINKLAGGYAASERLARLTKDPGALQIALSDPTALVPAGLFYDYAPFTTTGELSEYSLCPDFEAALAAGVALAGHHCFEGKCPSRGKDLVVCPSGFWGFRLYLGFPVSQPEAAPAIPADGASGALAGVTTDPLFTKLSDHTAALARLFTSWVVEDSRDQVLGALPANRQLVYFFCHGGSTRGVPYLEFGMPGQDPPFTSDLLRGRVRWEAEQPLVFINGCETTALGPEEVFNFVNGFVDTANAAGVLGTDITVFEPLAIAFAQAFLDGFFGRDRLPLGEAVRNARLVLLAEGNPLGLAYVPFVHAGLAVESAPAR